MTKILPYFRSHTACNFKNFEDVYDSLVASQCIPFVLGIPYAKYKNKIYIDGFFSNIFGYKPNKEEWFVINISKFSFYYFITGFFLFNKLYDEKYHKKLYEDGYNQAKTKHLYFKNNGFIEK